MSQVYFQPKLLGMTTDESTKKIARWYFGGIAASSNFLEFFLAEEKVLVLNFCFLKFKVLLV